jgi:hypothetical protein
VIARVVNRAWVDRSRFPAEAQATLADVRTDINQIVTDGRAAFEGADVGTLLGRTATLVSLLSQGECDGFLSAAASARASSGGLQERLDRRLARF